MYNMIIHVLLPGKNDYLASKVKRVLSIHSLDLYALEQQGLLVDHLVCTTFH